MCRRSSLDINVFFASQRLLSQEVLHSQSAKASLETVPSGGLADLCGDNPRQVTPGAWKSVSLLGQKSGDLALWRLYTLARMEAIRKHGRFGLVAKCFGIR